MPIHVRTPNAVHGWSEASRSELNSTNSGQAVGVGIATVKRIEKLVEGSGKEDEPGNSFALAV